MSPCRKYYVNKKGCFVRALVTGAAGFIGSHLCERLIRDGHEVIGVDDMSTGRGSNLWSLMKNKAFHLIIGDINELQFNSMEGVDWVFHLAAKADIVPSITHPLDYHDTNVNGTIRVLEAARLYKVKRFIYAASSSCYGIPDDFPTCERAQVRPEYPYALTKSVGEKYVLHWSRVYGVPAVSLRLFNVYGPRARTSGTYGAVFGVFLAQLANNQPITVVGDGEQKRDFTFVIDVCNAMVLAAESSQTTRMMNIGSGGTYSINHIAKLLGATDRVELPKRPGEPGITYADISRAKDLIGYRPAISIEEGCGIMRKIIPAFKDAPVWTAEKIKEETKVWFECLGAKE